MRALLLALLLGGLLWVDPSPQMVSSGIQSSLSESVSGALTYTETFYLSASGDGSAPETIAGAWDAADLDIGGNWATTDANDGKLGPNDRVIALDNDGDFRALLTILQSGLNGKPIAIQGESGGSATFNATDLVSTWTAASATETWGENGGDDYTGVTEDTYGEETNPDTNYGSSGNMRMKGNHIGVDRKNFISFDLTALSGTVTNADLKVLTGTGGKPIKVWDCSDNFTEAGATWNKYDGASAWTGTHGQNTLLDTTNSEASAYTTWSSVSLDSYIEANKGSRVYFVLWNDNDATDLFTNSSEAGANRPYLEITYTPTNVWQATVTTEPNQVFLDNTRGNKQASLGAVDSANDWFWAANVLYVYSTSDPDTAYTSPGIESGARNHAMTLNGQSYITVDGLILEKANHAVGSGVWMNGAGATRNVIENSTIRLNNSAGITVFTTDAQSGGHTIRNNTIHDNGGHGITFNAGTDGSSSGNETRISGNTIYNNNSFGVFAYTSWAIIESNTVYSNGNVSTEYGGIHIWGGAVDDPTANTGDNNIVRYNVSHSNISGGNDGTGIQLDIYSDDNQVYYNLTYNNDGPGVAVFADQGNVVYNNVAYDNCQDSSGELTTKSEFRVGDHASYTNTNTVLKNNIGFATQANTYAVYVGSGVTTPTIDSNLWYRAAGDWWWFGAGGGDVLATWNGKSGVGDDLNSDPLFVNAATPDFHLQSGSPARDAGTDVNRTRDYDGVTVPQETNPAIGAYEYVP